ncbi:MAG: MFS transporter [Chloroflexota bacterium]
MNISWLKPIIPNYMGLLRNIRTFESLALRDYRYLWLGQLSTSMGQWMDQVARAWLVYDITHSPLQLGLVSAARGLPLLLFGTVAGVFADRYSRKAQLVIAQVINALLNIVLAALIMTGKVQLWHIYVTGFLSGTVQAFQQPARQVLISDLVGEKHLLNAVALNSAALNLSRSVGPAIGGLLIHAVGVDFSYYTQAGLYVLATLWTFQMGVPKATESFGYSGISQSFFGSIKEGFDYIASHRIILALIVLGLAPIALGMPFISLMPVFAIDVFHGDARTQGMLLTMVGIGAVLGALIIASLRRGQGNGKLLVIGAAGFGISLALFAQSPVLLMAVGFTLLAGFFNSSYTSQSQTIIQTLVPPQLRGRVLGVYLLNRGLMPVGSLLAGAPASFMGGPWAVTAMGLSCFLLAVIITAFVPDLWKLNPLNK